MCRTVVALGRRTVQVQGRWVALVSAQDLREERIRWITSQILPHEAEVRAWLRRSLRGQGDVDDVVQEAYCRLSELPDHRHILNGRAYFFATVRSIVVHTVRRARLVPFEAADQAEIDGMPDEAPSPEQAVGARLQLRRALDLIAALPPAYRHALEMRRLHGFSQKETASYLGVTEKVVENNALRGLRLLMKRMAGDDDRHDDSKPDSARTPDPKIDPRDETAIHALH